MIPPIIVLPDMKLSPNVGSDRSWVWNTALDVSEDPTGEPQTLAIRFANSESMFQSFPVPSLCPAINITMYSNSTTLQMQTSSRKPS